MASLFSRFTSSAKSGATTESEGAESSLHPDVLALIEHMSFELIPGPKTAEHAKSLPAGARVSVTCSPVKGIPATLEDAELLLASGFKVVPHFAARMVESHDHVRRLVQWLSDNGVDDLFLIGGDGIDPLGPFGDAPSLVRGFLDAGVTVKRIGSGGYPDGHPNIPTSALTQSLVDRQAMLKEAGIDGWISTQMCFEHEAVSSWVREIRAAGVETPIHLGVPGALEVAKLLTVGARVGVGASLRYLKKNRSIVSRLVTPGGYDPLELLEPLSDSVVSLGIEDLHVFTFNQVARTAQWRIDAIDNAHSIV